MDIGNWSATTELNKIFSDSRELGLESNLLELEAFGFTVVGALQDIWRANYVPSA